MTQRQMFLVGLNDSPHNWPIFRNGRGCRFIHPSLEFRLPSAMFDRPPRSMWHLPSRTPEVWRTAAGWACC